MLRRLDLETRMHHLEVDGPWLALMAHDVKRADYVGQLIRLYGFESPLEAALAYTPGVGSLIDLRARARSGYLAQDLIELGLSAAFVAQISQCLIAPFATAGEALGWLYVTERSTLLHDTLRRHLSKRMPLVGDAFHYLSASEGLVSARWHELGRVLDRYATTPALVDQVMVAAHDGFRTQRAWFRSPHAARIASAR